jgi:hypothetical protein
VRADAHVEPDRTHVTDQPPFEKKTPIPPDRSDIGERPTLNPPFDLEAFARAAEVADPNSPDSFDTMEPETATRTDRVTITNELALEAARAKSAQGSEPPRGTRTSGLLSIVNARVPSNPAPRSLSPSSLEVAVVGELATSSGPEITERWIEDPSAEMRERFSLGDYTGALEMVDLILADDPANLDAAECGENCRHVLENMYAAKLGPTDRVPVVIVARTQMRWLSIDHRAGFILSLVDGVSSLEMVLDVSGMPRLDALRILHDLVQQHIVAFR